VPTVPAELVPLPVDVKYRPYSASIRSMSSGSQPDSPEASETSPAAMSSENLALTYLL